MGRYPQMRRRSLTAWPIADAVARLVPSRVRGTAGEVRVSSAALAVSSPLHVQSGTVTQPHPRSVL